MSQEFKDRKRTPSRTAKESAVNPLPTPMPGDENQPSPATQAQEASFEPYEGQFEEFRKQPEADRHGVRRDPADVMKHEKKQRRKGE